MSEQVFSSQAIKPYNEVRRITGTLLDQRDRQLSSGQDVILADLNGWILAQQTDGLCAER